MINIYLRPVSANTLVLNRVHLTPFKKIIKIENVLSINGFTNLKKKKSLIDDSFK